MPRTHPPASAAREPLTFALGTPAKVATLRVLAAAGESLTQREVARRAGVQHRAVSRALDDLVPLGIVTRHEGGRDHPIRLNDEHRLCEPLRALFDTEAGHFVSLRARLAEEARACTRRTGLVNLVLFGSMARARDGAASDCDLLLVVRDPARVDAALAALAPVARAVETSHGCRIRPIVFALKEAARLWRANEPPFPGIRRDALVLFGPPLEESLRGQA